MTGRRPQDQADREQNLFDKSQLGSGPNRTNQDIERLDQRLPVTIRWSGWLTKHLPGVVMPWSECDSTPVTLVSSREWPKSWPTEQL